MTVICYQDKNGKDFLAYYTYKTLADGAAECAQLNSERPTKLWNGEKIDWDNIDKFFVSKQDIMEG